MLSRIRKASPYMGMGLVTLAFSALFAYQLTSVPLRATEDGPDPVPKKEKCQPGDWKKPVAANLALPEEILKPFNTAASKIGLKFSEPKVSVQKKTKDCCDDKEDLHKDGVTEISGTASVKITAKSIPVPELAYKGHFECKGRWGRVEGEIDVGVFLDADAEIKGTLSETTDVCKPANGCFGAELGGTVTISGSAKVNVIGKVRFFRRKKVHMVNIGIKPAELSIIIEGSVSKNRPNCGDKLKGSVAVKQVVLSATLTIPGLKKSKTWSKVLYDGGTFPAGG